MDRLYSAVSQLQVHHLRVAADQILPTAFALGLPLQTASPLHSPLYYPDLLDDFVRDNSHIATHLSHNMHVIADLGLDLYSTWSESSQFRGPQIVSFRAHNTFHLFATQTLGQFPCTPITGRSSDYVSNS